MQIDKEIITFCKSQNRDGQRQLYELLLPYLRAIANRYLRDTSYVKDVLQESFIKIFKHINQYDENRAKLDQWAARIVINTALNYNKRVIGLPNEEFIIAKHEEAVLPATFQNLSNADLLILLKHMPKKYFEVFNLFAIDEFKHEEIAQLLGISKALSRKRLSRARNWLKKSFQKTQHLHIDLNLSKAFLK